LEILGKRDDGYHELSTVMTRVTLSDAMTFQVLDSDLELWVTADNVADARELPDPHSNLIFRTLEHLRRRMGCQRGMRVEVVKRIPIKAGLGGASSNSATTLLAANKLWQLGLTAEELASIANELGSDITYFLTPGVALCRGRGELVTPLSMKLNWPIMLVQPPFGLSTAEMFQAFRNPQWLVSTEQFIERLQSCETPSPDLRLFNRFEELAAQRSPWFGEIRDSLLRLGAIGAQMTGSGSCYFGVFSHLERAAQARLAIAQQFPDCRTWVCETSDSAPLK
jgi:4-diphosphocytidyl-2-C-methyl-D-erythritol kinase